MTQNDINLINLIPQFLKFYQLAYGCDEATRYELWKEHYGFAAVPPGREGEELARKLLDDAWDKYAEIIPVLEKWQPDCGKIEQYLCKIKEVLKCNEPIKFTLVFFVGSFEGNAFAAQQDENSIAICLPVENGLDDVMIVHELIHLVHSKTSDFKMSWEKTLAVLILSEGLATRLSQHLLPDCDDSLHIEHQEGWLEQCEKVSDHILQGIIPYLDSCSSECIWQFTLGNGTTGNPREAYFAGWKIIDRMLTQGLSFFDIAGIRERDASDIIRKYIN